MGGCLRTPNRARDWEDSSYRTGADECPPPYLPRMPLFNPDLELSHALILEDELALATTHAGLSQELVVPGEESFRESLHRQAPTTECEQGVSVEGLDRPVPSVWLSGFISAWARAHPHIVTATSAGGTRSFRATDEFWREVAETLRMSAGAVDGQWSVRVETTALPVPPIVTCLADWNAACEGWDARCVRALRRPDTPPPSPPPLRSSAAPPAAVLRCVPPPSPPPPETSFDTESSRSESHSSANSSYASGEVRWASFASPQSGPVGCVLCGGGGGAAAATQPGARGSCALCGVAWGSNLGAEEPADGAGEPLRAVDSRLGLPASQLPGFEMRIRDSVALPPASLRCGRGSVRRKRDTAPKQRLVSL
eukprot:TRINITY_DN40064_c0_g1_i1.p1 TRINITY_DN40064_c0_g1~~TRINITY_DN40064_c0_g1_i1.p1  ORF type:complete len:368 (+),score=-18.75 TRINITY_DN40064_c0_g1_i1:62-1165(+)